MAQSFWLLFIVSCRSVTGCVDVNVTVGANIGSHFVTIYPTFPVASCMSPCGQGCRANEDWVNAIDTFATTVINEYELYVERTDTSSEWGMNLAIPCCRGVPLAVGQGNVRMLYCRKMEGGCVKGPGPWEGVRGVRAHQKGWEPLELPLKVGQGVGGKGAPMATGPVLQFACRENGVKGHEVISLILGAIDSLHRMQHMHKQN